MDTLRLYAKSYVTQRLMEKDSYASITDEKSLPKFIKAVDVFTEFALRHIKNVGLMTSKSPKSIEPSQSARDVFVGRLTSFINHFTKAFFTSFDEASECSSGARELFPVLMNTKLNNKCSSLLHFVCENMTGKVSIDYLTKVFGKTIPIASRSEIRPVLQKLMNQCQEGNSEAGYTVLWMINSLTGSNCHLPDPDSTITIEHIKKSVSNFLKHIDEKTFNSHAFIELLLLPIESDQTCLYHQVLQEETNKQFLDFVINKVSLNTSSSWPALKKVIIHLTVHLTMTQKKTLMKELKERTADTTIKNIGTFGYELVRSKPVSTRTVNYMLQLQKIFSSLPGYNTYLERAFLFPIPTLCNKSFTIRRETSLQAHQIDLQAVASSRVHSPFLIGMYAPNIPAKLFHKNGLSHSPWIAAFSPDTYELVWCRPATVDQKRKMRSDKSKYNLDVYLDEIHIYRNGIPCSVLDINTGNPIPFSQHIKAYDAFAPSPKDKEVIVKLSREITPVQHYTTYASISTSNSSPTRYVYRITCVKRNQHIECTKVERDDSKLLHSVSLTDQSRLQDFNTHLAFTSPTSDVAHILSPYGSLKTQCMDMKYSQKNLYMIQRNPSNPDKCLLTVQKLKEDAAVMARPHMQLGLPMKSASIAGVCNNGIVILYEDNKGKTPIFVNIKTKQACKFPDIPKEEKQSSRYIDKRTGTLFIYDDLTKKIYSICEKGASKIGILHSDSDIQIVYVNEAGEIFFKETPLETA